MEGSAALVDLGAPPESWEVADLDASMRRLMVSSSNKESISSSSAFNNQSELSNSAASSISRSGSGVLEDAINSVDQFLREAIQNPRERLSVLRMEQEIEKFIKDPTRQQMEFLQLPTSYLRLAAHRVAQHYSLQSMVLMDNSIPDGSGSKIIVCKTSECRIPAVRLADIPFNLLTDESCVVKVAIKQRQKGSQNANASNSQLSRTNSSKSVEERKEEYNRARARIFNSNISTGGANGKPDGGSRTQDSVQHGSLTVSKSEEKSIQAGASDMNFCRGAIDPSAGSSRSAARSRPEKEPVVRYRTNNRVAIFRDRDYDRKDPDYDRSYDRYMQRFDPGFGFSGRPYIIQPMYAPTLTYNTEFPQLGPVYRPSVSVDLQPRPLPQHLPGPWVAPSPSAGIGYGLPETMISPYSPNHVGGHSNSALFLHTAQYSSQHPGMPLIHPHEHIHQVLLQSHQQQPDTSFGLARPQ